MRWATVTDASPLRIRLDGDTDALPYTPDSLVDPAALAVDDRVRCELADRRVVILGRSGGDFDPTVIAGIENTRQIRTFVWANTAARTAQTGMVAGDQGWQADTAVAYTYVAGAWRVEYETLTNAVTARTGYTVSTQRVRRQGRVVSVTVRVTKNSGNWSGAAEYFADINVAGLRPDVAYVVGAGSDENTAALRTLTIFTDGSMLIAGANGVSGANPQTLHVTYIVDSL